MKKGIFSILAIAIGIFIIFRIKSVNTSVQYPEIKEYGMQEEVFVGNNIFMESYERMDGYAIVVKEAEIMTYEEFLEKFQYNETVQGTLFQKDEMIYPEMVCNIKIVVKNKDQEDNPDKGINFQNYVLYGEEFQLQLSEALYSVANPNMKEGQMSFRLQPETEKEFYLPFYFSPSRKTESLQIEEVGNSKLYLPISLYPEQRQIVLENLS